MRNAFINELIARAEADRRVALLMAEVGFSVVEPFEKKFPERFFNVGIAEQNLVAAAAGMAMAGMRPVAYSMSCFLPSRAFEQIKVSVCYQNLPVVLAGVGSGLSYGELGATHHAAEESNLLRSLPNLRVMFPADAPGIAEALKYALAAEGPSYIGFPKAPAPDLPARGFMPDRAVLYREGNDGAMIAVGYMAGAAVKAADMLAEKGVNVAVYGLHTVKPLDREAVYTAAKTGGVFVIDEHYAGVGNEIAAIILEAGISVKRFIDFSVPDAFAEKVLCHGSLLDESGLSAEKIAKRIARVFGI